MRNVGLTEFYRWLSSRRPVRCLGVRGEVTITGVAVDSREVEKGDLFVAARGECVDGHDFIPEAVRRGAAAVLAERPLREPIPQLLIEKTRDALGEVISYFLGDPSRELRVVGITGTNGKTTTASCLWRIFSEADGITAGLLGTVENILGRDPETGRLLTATPVTTTPGPLELHKAFHTMVESGVRSCAMEVSSHGLVQERVTGIAFSAAVLTNVTSDHLDYHGSFEAYREAKSRLFRSLGARSVAVVNRADPSFEYFAGSTKAPVVPYSLRGWPGLRECRVETDGCVKLELSDSQGGLSVRTRLWGRHNAENLLAAVCCARSLGVEWDPIARALSTLRPPPGRLEEIPNEEFRVFVDYAHTASALSEVLSSLRPIASEGRLLVVFGCGGDRDRTKRSVMGRVAYEKADFVFVTSDNPRTERPQAIIGEILRGIPRGAENVRVEVDRREAIRKAVREARRGDVLLIAGKGHEDYQVVGTEKLHFDDRETAREALEELNRVAS